MRKRYFHWEWGFGILIALNLSYLALRQAQAVLLLSENESEKLLKFLKKNVPQHSKIIGDDAFFYFCLEAGIRFEICQWKLDDELRERLHRQQYDYDYFITSLPVPSSHPFHIYSSKSKLIAQDTFLIRPLDRKNLIVKLLQVDRSALNCIVWKRDKNLDK
jgi:hypothetical protein